MPIPSQTLRTLVAIGVVVFSLPSYALPNTTTLAYTVTRNGDRIGASTVQFIRDGAATVAEVHTNVQVRIAYITVYSFDQRETERWVNGRLISMNSVTDDNGTVHKVAARRNGDALSVAADGRVMTVDPTVIPVALWNHALLQQTRALDPQSGELTPVKVVDHGEEPLMLHGKVTMTHHYSINTGFVQDVWYDRHDRVVKVELHAVDGSEIQYRPT